VRTRVPADGRYDGRYDAAGCLPWRDGRQGIVVVRRSRRGRPRNAPSRADRRDELLTAAITAIRRDGPTTSMAAIAAEAGLSKPVVYAHFGDRAGLAAAIAGSVAGGDDLEPAIRATLATFVDFSEREPELFSFLLHPGGSHAPDAELHSLIETFAAYLEPPATTGLEPLGVPAAEVSLRVRAVLGLAYTTVDWWRREGRDEFTAHGIVERLTSLVMAVLEAS
jgi:AcrR family transcriptional regulator